MDANIPDNTNSSSILLGYWFIIKRRWQPALCAFAGVFALNAISLFSKTPIYRSTGQIRLNVVNNSSKLAGLEELSDWTGDKTDRQILTEMEIMVSKPVLRETFLQLEKKLGPGQVDFSLLEKETQITPIIGTDLVNVAVKDSDPEIAAKIANQLMETYVDFNLRENRSKATASKIFIEQELPRLRHNVLIADNNLRQFMEDFQITNLGDIGRDISSVQLKVQSQLDTVEEQIAKVESESSAIQSKLGVNVDSALKISAISQLPTINEARSKLENVRRQLAIAKSSLKPNHPTVIDLTEQQSQLQKVLLQSTRATTSGTSNGSIPQPADRTRQSLLDTLVKLNVTHRGLLQQKEVLTGQLNYYTKRSNMLPGVSQKLRQLKRELEAAETTYKTLLHNLQGTQITENQTIPSAKIVEFAEATNLPVAPNKFTGLARGCFAAILMAIGIAYLLEKIDSKLKTVDEVRFSYQSWPVLGSVPIYSSKSEKAQLPTIEIPRSPMAEAYRMLQANIRFLRSDSDVRVLVLSSAFPQEGKSWTISNLAVVLSQSNHKVLLIDVDLRRPTLHHIWEINNSYGLSNVLTNYSNKEKLSSLFFHRVQPGLDVLTAGTSPPNPQALLDSQNFKDFIAEQSENYDFVLIDTPPLTVAADALIASKVSDGLLIVGRPEYLTKAGAKRTTEILKQVDANVLGLFVNGVNTKNEISSYYYYSQDYRSNEVDDEKLEFITKSYLK